MRRDRRKVRGQEYDAALKLLLQAGADLTLQEFEGMPIARWLRVELPKVENTRADLLGETSDGRLLHIELQSTNDSSMLVRMAEYCVQVYRLHRRVPKQIVLYVGDDPVRMKTELSGPDFSFRYRLVDMRDMDGERLLRSANLSDNVIAVLARLRDRQQAVGTIVEKIATCEPGERHVALVQLMILAGLRRVGVMVEQEIQKVPILHDILDHEVIGREFKKGLAEGLREGEQKGREEGREEGELNLLRKILISRFGPLPARLQKKLLGLSTEQVSGISSRIWDAETLQDVFR